MANRNWANGGKIYSMHVMPVLANTNITIGASGAVSSFIGTIVSSITHVSTGIYKINFVAGTNFNAMLFAAGACQSPSSGLSGIMQVEIQNAPTTSVQSVATPSLTVKCLNASGAVADPASGSVLSVLSIMSNSSIKA